jgi:predicted DNA-binding transcriptional regulator AlpA
LLALGRLVDVDHLVSAIHIAERLGCARPTVYAWIASDSAFPVPVFTSAGPRSNGVRLWYWPDVEAWQAGRGARDGRRFGRPPATA